MKFYAYHFRRFIIFLLGGFICCLLAMVCLNAIFDPLHILRFPAENDYYDSESRFGMPGPIHANASKHAVVGTSIVQDFDEAYYHARTGQSLSRYLLPGGTAYEQRRLLETLLVAPTPPETVIWGIAPTSFFAPGVESLRWSQFPEYLFKPEPFLPRYIFSFETFYRLLRQIPDRMTHRTQTPSERFTTDSKKMPLGRDYIYSSYCGPKTAERIARLGEYDYNLMQAHIDHNMLPVIEKHPEVHFILFLPPYSLVQFVEFDKGGVLDEVMEFRTLAAKAVSRLPNVTLYDFASDIALISNDADHRDSIHYGPATTRRMIDDILADRRRIKNGEIAIQNTRLQQAVDRSRARIWNDIAAYCQKSGQPVKN
jgi:hypothetical protein